MKTSHLVLFSMLLLVTALPLLTQAQGAPTTNTLQYLLYVIPRFIEQILIPFLMGMAFLAFVVNAIRYFVIEGESEQGRDKAKNLALYSVAAFVFLIIFWGIVNILINTIGLGNQQPICPDYMKINNLCPGQSAPADDMSPGGAPSDCTDPGPGGAC